MKMSPWKAVWKGCWMLTLLVPALASPLPADLPAVKPGVLLMAHGGRAEWNRAVEDAVAPLRRVCPVEIAFGMAQRSTLHKAVARLEAQGVNRVAVVRLFVSNESFRPQTEYLLGLRPDPPAQFLEHPGDLTDWPQAHHTVRFLSPRRAPAPIRHATRMTLNPDGLYDSSTVAAIVVERVGALSTTPARESVLILAHGEEDEGLNRTWIAKLEKVAQQVRASAPFRRVRVQTVREDWKEKRRQSEQAIRDFVRHGNREGERVLVVPFRVFGFGPYAQVLEGLEYVSDGRGLLPHPAVTAWIREQAGKCFQRIGTADPFLMLHPRNSEAAVD